MTVYNLYAHIAPGEYTCILTGPYYGSFMSHEDAYAHGMKLYEEEGCISFHITASYVQP